MATIQDIEQTRGLVKHVAYKLFISATESGKEAYNSSADKRDLRWEFFVAVGKGIFYLSIILAIVGSEAVKIIMRKNYGARGIDLVYLWISIICFLIIGGIGAFVFQDGAYKDNYFTPISGLIAVAFYFILSGILIKKAISINIKRRSDISFYEGDSKYLSGLILYGWKENTVKNVSEPFLVIFIGIFLVSFLGIFCLPIIFCGFSIWVRQLAIKFSNFNPIRNEYNPYEYGAGTSEFNVVS